MKFRRLLSAVTALAVPAASIAQTVVRTDDRAPGRPGRVAVTTADGNIAQVEAVVPIRADGTVIDPAGGGGGGSSAVAQGSTTAGQSGGLTQAAVVSGDQAYTVGTTQPLNLTGTGRLKVGLSSNTNVTPGTIPVTTTSAELVACQYRASPVTWTDTNTGSLRCGPDGAIAVGGSVPAAATASGNPVAIGGDYNTTLPTYTATQRVMAQYNAKGAQYIAITGSTGTAAQVDAVGLYTVAKGTATLASGQVSVGTTATQIVAAQSGRGRLTVTVDAAVKCYIGPSGVTTATGYPLQATAGASHTMNTSAAVFMVCATAATTVGYIVES